MSGRLEGKVVIITGATSGIGYRTAEIFVEEGAQVLLAGRRTEKGEQLANKLGASSVFLRTDVTQEEDVEAMISTAMERC